MIGFASLFKSWPIDQASVTPFPIISFDDSINSTSNYHRSIVVGVCDAIGMRKQQTLNVILIRTVPRNVSCSRSVLVEDMFAVHTWRPRENSQINISFQLVFRTLYETHLACNTKNNSISNDLRRFVMSQVKSSRNKSDSSGFKTFLGLPFQASAAWFWMGLRSTASAIYLHLRYNNEFFLYLRYSAMLFSVYTLDSLSDGSMESGTSFRKALQSRAGRMP